MNYYIQGCAARAEQIKAAFEKLGYDVSGFDMCNDNILFFTYKLQGGGKVISTTNAHLYTANIIKTHPDYKELELPVEPKFKVGDKISWINHDCDTQTITDIRDGSYITVDKHGVRCALKFVNQDKWELVPKPHYDIANFQPFDKVLVRDGDDTKWRCNWFSHYSGEGGVYRFVTTKCGYAQCIPFEGNEHLLGTTDPCDEQYINW